MYLFVSGCPRSGTTVLTRLLNLHPDVVVGLERYKGRFGKSKDLSPQMFTPEHFFHFKQGDTNFEPSKNEDAKAFYDKAQAKFPTAQYVGDKYPQFYRFYGSIFKAMPDAKIVFIVRDPVYVAQSWQRRSEDSTSWPAKNDARKAISYWNDALAYTLAYTQVKKGAFIFVDYVQFFQAKLDGLMELYGWLGLRVTPDIRAEVEKLAEAEYKRSEEVLGREVDLKDEVLEEITREADRNLYRRAQRIIESQRKAAE